MARRKTQFWESAGLNNSTFRQYYNRLVELSIAMFEWHNLPDTVDPRFMELTLFTDGQAVFFKDDVVGFACLQNALGGNMDMYRIPKDRRAYAVNGFSANLTDKNSVIIWNNMLHTNSMNDVTMFAKRLYNIDRAIDVNTNAQKTPILIRCDEQQRLTLKNIYMQYDGNQPVIFGDKGLVEKPLDVMTTGAPYVADRLYELKTQYWNEALTYLGITNTNQTKKERLLADEVSSNLGSTFASRYSRLISRQTACEQINKMFGTDIWVNYREDFRGRDSEGEDYEADETEPKIKDGDLNE